jgi:hypothetical protein
MRHDLSGYVVIYYIEDYIIARHSHTDVLVAGSRACRRSIEYNVTGAADDDANKKHEMNDDSVLTQRCTKASSANHH